MVKGWNLTRKKRLKSKVIGQGGFSIDPTDNRII